jgi:hypothetical protein
MRNKGAEADSRRSWIVAGAGLLCFAGVSWLLMRLALHSVLMVWVAIDGALPDYRLPLAVSWKTFACLFLLTVAAILARWLARRLAGLGFKRRWTAALLVAAMAAALGPLVQSYFQQLRLREALLSADDSEVDDLQDAHDDVVTCLGANHWGWRYFGKPNSEWIFKPNNGEVDLLELSMNSYGYRDDEWVFPKGDDGVFGKGDDGVFGKGDDGVFSKGDDGVSRVLLVGDSTVVGLSIRKKADMLDTLIEANLKESSDQRWDVWNISAAPASIRYFAEAVMRAAPDARASHVVVYVNCRGDIFFLDEQLAMADKPSWFYSLASISGVWKQILKVAANPWLADLKDLEKTARWNRPHLAAFERLLAYAAEASMHVVVWEAFGPCTFFEPYRELEHVTFVDYRYTSQPEPRPLYEDPALGFSFTGHLTPKGMALVAEVLAKALVAGKDGLPAPPEVPHATRGLRSRPEPARAR